MGQRDDPPAAGLADLDEDAAAALPLDDRLDLLVILRERPTARLHIEYELKRAGELCLTGHTVHAFVNHQGEVVKPPADVLEKMRSFFPKH